MTLIAPPAPVTNADNLARRGIKPPDIAKAVTKHPERELFLRDGIASPQPQLPARHPDMRSQRSVEPRLAVLGAIAALS